MSEVPDLQGVPFPRVGAVASGGVVKRIVPDHGGAERVDVAAFNSSI